MVNIWNIWFNDGYSLVNMGFIVVECDFIVIFHGILMGYTLGLIMVNYGDISKQY